MIACAQRAPERRDRERVDRAPARPPTNDVGDVVAEEPPFGHAAATGVASAGRRAAAASPSVPRRRRSVVSQTSMPGQARLGRAAVRQRVVRDRQSLAEPRGRRVDRESRDELVGARASQAPTGVGVVHVWPSDRRREHDSVAARTSGRAGSPPRRRTACPSAADVRRRQRRCPQSRERRQPRQARRSGRSARSSRRRRSTWRRAPRPTAVPRCVPVARPRRPRPLRPRRRRPAIRRDAAAAARRSARRPRPGGSTSGQAGSTSVRRPSTSA